MNPFHQTQGIYGDRSMFGGPYMNTISANEKEFYIYSVPEVVCTAAPATAQRWKYGTITNMHKLPFFSIKFLFNADFVIVNRKIDIFPL